MPPLTDEQVDEILFSKLSLKEGDLHLTLLIRTAAPALWKAIVAERQLLVGSGRIRGIATVRNAQRPPWNDSVR